MGNKNAKRSHPSVRPLDHAGSPSKPGSDAYGYNWNKDPKHKRAATVGKGNRLPPSVVSLSPPSGRRTLFSSFKSKGSKKRVVIESLSPDPKITHTSISGEENLYKYGVNIRRYLKIKYTGIMSEVFDSEKSIYYDKETECLIISGSDDPWIPDVCDLVKVSISAVPRGRPRTLSSDHNQRPTIGDHTFKESGLDIDIGMDKVIEMIVIIHEKEDSVEMAMSSCLLYEHISYIIDIYQGLTGVKCELKSDAQKCGHCFDDNDVQEDKRHSIGDIDIEGKAIRGLRKYNEVKNEIDGETWEMEGNMSSEELDEIYSRANSSSSNRMGDGMNSSSSSASSSSSSSPIGSPMKVRKENEDPEGIGEHGEE